MIQIHTCDQGSLDWYKIRSGMPTASEFATVLASGKGGGESITRKKYLYRLAGEIITGEPEETYQSADMARGKVMEESAREHYAFVREADPELVGFISNGPKGCSPDALLDHDGLLEIKTAKPSVQIERLQRNDLPPEHKAQCQGALWICERTYLDFVSYWPKMPPLIVRVERDEAYIANLAAEVDRFNEELAEVVDRVRRYGQAEALVR